MDKQKAFKIYKEFYSNNFNLEKIFKTNNLIRKEFAFYNKYFTNYQMKRHFAVTSPEFLKEIIRFNCLFWIDKNINKMYNLYASMITYNRQYPLLAYMNENKERRWTYEDSISFTQKIPLVIDVDSDSLEDLKVHAQFVKKICDYLEEPRIFFSGMGFHIYDEELSLKFNNDMSLIIDFASFLNQTVTEFVDLKIYEYRRILKLKHSIAVYEEEKDNFRIFKVEEVFLDELDDFDYKRYEII